VAAMKGGSAPEKHNNILVTPLRPATRSGNSNIQQKAVFLNLDISTTTPSNLVKFRM
jgi:hypothetical protein